MTLKLSEQICSGGDSNVITPIQSYPCFGVNSTSAPSNSSAGTLGISNTYSYVFAYDNTGTAIWQKTPNDFVSGADKILGFEFYSSNTILLAVSTSNTSFSLIEVNISNGALTSGGVSHIYSISGTKDGGTAHGSNGLHRILDGSGYSIALDKDHYFVNSSFVLSSATPLTSASFNFAVIFLDSDHDRAFSQNTANSYVYKIFPANNFCFRYTFANVGPYVKMNEAYPINCFGDQIHTYPSSDNRISFSGYLHGSISFKLDEWSDLISERLALLGWS